MRRFPETPTIIAALAICAALAGPAVAASTQWQDLGGGKARLIANLDPATSQVSGVIEFDLDEGWKTYWREPGSSGIPPQFDFSGSRHFAAGDIGFPVPEHVVLPESEFVGYHGRVRFTFEGMVTGSPSDGLIRLNLLAGVCEEICIPATVEFEMPTRELMVSDPEAEQVIEEAALALPADPSETFRIESAKLTGNVLEIAATLPDANGEAALFVEGPSNWRLLPARIADRDGTKARFELDLSNMPADAEPERTQLRFTLVSNGKGVEQSLTPE